MLCIFIVSTYSEGNPPENCRWCCEWISDAASDFRVQKTLFLGMKFTVFGLGDSLYLDNFNKVSKPSQDAVFCLGGSILSRLPSSWMPVWQSYQQHACIQLDWVTRTW